MLSETAPRPGAAHGAEGFRHEAFLYHGAFGFLQGTLPFIEAGIEAGTPVLVVVDGDKIKELRTLLGADARRVMFRDMADVGHNPARIIPAWRDFLDQQGRGRRPVRGIGELSGPGAARPSWSSASATRRC